MPAGRRLPPLAIKAGAAALILVCAGLAAAGAVFATTRPAGPAARPTCSGAPARYGDYKRDGKPGKPDESGRSNGHRRYGDRGQVPPAYPPPGYPPPGYRPPPGYPPPPPPGYPPPWPPPGYPPPPGYGPSPAPSTARPPSTSAGYPTPAPPT
ncbi:hypothetical protein Ssi03_66340 [Sphaerisporangium siamense]|uniref:Uncharacterized protein n=1 Tax=Sphaerisporangium siamense TaxID=795645 RepID=A0A7W7GGE5_9ACTN|nr:hypothetical protein [Sphaerisporangium siamense]MBB4706001.1 hypothetical protein [Sphaerisporangium siamense]GII88644.1 hypothetical protein Ssi03_66340 [Sphaerisporangium siamense]